MHSKRADKSLSRSLQQCINAAQARDLANSALVAPWLARKASDAEPPPQPKEKKKKKKSKKEVVQEDGAGFPPVLPNPPTSHFPEHPSWDPEASTPACPSLTSRGNVIGTAHLDNQEANPTLLAEEVTADPSATSKVAGHSAGEHDLSQTSGPAVITAHETFRLGRGKPFHLLFGKDAEGEPGPSYCCQLTTLPTLQVLSDDGKKVRRLQPFTEVDVDELQKEGHKQKTELLLESFRCSNFFVRIADSDEPLWSKRSVAEAPSTKSEIACGKVHSDVGDSKEECHNFISAVIDQGSFDCSASSGVARNNVRCFSLPSGDIVVNYNHSDATH
ncbi:hypothetical protein KSP39_PZI019273 [Platanthera zijinensis]|uniref:Uncharacterized protein n=1 Tax=Platanthera zijinensis TaxID=2320716 RepID=A0AAP0FXX3_9ASPA